MQPNYYVIQRLLKRALVALLLVVEVVVLISNDKTLLFVVSIFWTCQNELKKNTSKSILIYNI